MGAAAGGEMGSLWVWGWILQALAVYPRVLPLPGITDARANLHPPTLQVGQAKGLAPCRMVERWAARTRSERSAARQLRPGRAAHTAPACFRVRLLPHHSATLQVGSQGGG